MTTSHLLPTADSAAIASIAPRRWNPFRALAWFFLMPALILGALRGDAIDSTGEANSANAPGKRSWKSADGNISFQHDLSQWNFYPKGGGFIAAHKKQDLMLYAESAVLDPGMSIPEFTAIFQKSFEESARKKNKEGEPTRIKWIDEPKKDYGTYHFTFERDTPSTTKIGYGRLFFAPSLFCMVQLSGNTADAAARKDAVLFEKAVTLAAITQKTNLSASAQNADVNTAAWMFYGLRGFCIPTNATGLVTLFHENTQTKQNIVIPGRFWMNETAAVWQIEYASMSRFSAAEKKRLRDTKLDQLRIILSLNSEKVYLVYTHAKAFVESKATVSMKPPGDVRFVAGKTTPGESSIVDAGPETYNGNFCRKYQLRSSDKKATTTFSFWLSEKHQNFPLKILLEKTDGSGISGGGTFTMVDFEVSDHSVFNVPPGYTQFKTEEELIRHQRRLASK